MKTRTTLAFLLSCSVLLRADPEIFFGENISLYPNGPNQVPRPTDLTNTLRAAAQFYARLSGTLTESFEGFTPGSTPTNLVFGTNIATLSGTDTVVQTQPDPTQTSLGGFPLTGSNTLNLAGSTGQFFTVEFSAPQSAFGFFASDVEQNQLVLTLVSASGLRRDIQVPVTTPQGSGGCFYFGLLDRDSPFIRVEFHNIGPRNDGFDFDDMTIAVPEQVIPLPHLGIRVSQVELCWSTVSNAWYQLQYRSTLTTNEWAPLSPNWLRGDGGVFCTNDAVLSGQPQRFYRVVVTNALPQF